MNVVRPSSASSSPRLIAASVWASTDDVASSRIRIRGSASSARAIAIRCRCPLYREIADHGLADRAFLQRDLEEREEVARL